MSFLSSIRDAAADLHRDITTDHSAGRIGQKQIARAMQQDSTRARVFDGGPDAGPADAMMGAIPAFEGLTVDGYEQLHVLRLGPDRFGIIGSNTFGLPISYALQFEEPTDLETLHDVMRYGTQMANGSDVSVEPFDVRDRSNYAANLEELGRISPSSTGNTDRTEAMVMERAAIMHENVQSRAVSALSLNSRPIAGGITDPFAMAGKDDPTTALGLDELRFLGGGSPFLIDQVNHPNGSIDTAEAQDRVVKFEALRENRDAGAYLESAPGLHRDSLEAICAALDIDVEAERALTA